MTDTSTEAVLKLLEGVTPGTWQQGELIDTTVFNWNFPPNELHACICDTSCPQDAAFFAAARDLVPALLAERDALRAELEAVARNGWKPIASAPKDRLVDIWLTDGVRWCDCYHDRYTDTWRTSRPSGRLLTIHSRFVSHWMNGPKPPADLVKGAQDGNQSC